MAVNGPLAIDNLNKNFKFELIPDDQLAYWHRLVAAQAGVIERLDDAVEALRQEVRELQVTVKELKDEAVVG